MLTVDTELDRPRQKHFGPDRITVGFNLALFSFLNAMGIFKFVLSERAKGVPLAGLALISALDLARFTVVLFLTAYFVKAFWQRLISPLFTIRPIDYQEAIAIVLLLNVLVSI